MSRHVNMLCDEQTYRFEGEGPALGGPATFDTETITIQRDGLPLGINLFAIQFEDTAGDLVETAGVELMLNEHGSDDVATSIRIVDRTAGSVEGVVVGRLLVAFPKPLVVPMGHAAAARRMQPRLRLTDISLNCTRWVAWLAVVRGEKKVYEI